MSNTQHIHTHTHAYIECMSIYTCRPTQVRTHICSDTEIATLVPIQAIRSSVPTVTHKTKRKGLCALYTIPCLVADMCNSVSRHSCGLQVGYLQKECKLNGTSSEAYMYMYTCILSIYLREHVHVHVYYTIIHDIHVYTCTCIYIYIYIWEKYGVCKCIFLVIGF